MYIPHAERALIYAAILGFSQFNGIFGEWNLLRTWYDQDLVSVLVPTPMLPLSTGANRLSSAFAAEESSSIIMIPF